MNIDELVEKYLDESRDDNESMAVMARATLQSNNPRRLIKKKSKSFQYSTSKDLEPKQ